MKRQITAIGLGAWLVSGMCSLAQVGQSDPLRVKPEAMEAWKDMRFGMFISWGPVTLTGHEIGWSRGRETSIEEYDNLYKTWNPDKFDAKEWVKTARETGCRYLVFLVKHHDGFCLWDTKQTDYNIMNGAFKRDVAGEIAAACRDQGIGFFPYYSTCDFHHPDFPGGGYGGRVIRKDSNLDRYTDYLEAQCKELIVNYGPLLGLWFDVPQHFDKTRGERVIRFVRSLQPDIIVNNRTGAPGDFDTPEERVGRCQFDRPWECCIPLGTQWAWKPDDTLKSPTDTIKMLVACAIGDGNLVLNTNPMPDGRIEPRQVETFRKVGDWLKPYGESIYGTRGGPFVAPGGGEVHSHGGKFLSPEGMWWGGSTHKGNVIYLHILRWPALSKVEGPALSHVEGPEEALKLPAIGPRIVKSSVLTGGQVEVKQTASGITVVVPAAHRAAIDTIIKLELDQPAAGLAPIIPKAVRKVVDPYAVLPESRKRFSHRMQNEFCFLEVNAVDNNLRFMAIHKASGHCFFNGWFDSGRELHQAEVRKRTLQDQNFGPGEGVEVVYPNGDRNTVAVYPGVPFLVVHATRHNGDAQAKDTDRGQDAVLIGEVLTGARAPEIRTLGAGGLIAPGRNAGGAVFLAAVNPDNHGAAVGGWLTGNRGGGIRFSLKQNSAVDLQARMERGSPAIAPGMSSSQETLILGWFDEARAGLETAEALKRKCQSKKWGQ